MSQIHIVIGFKTSSLQSEVEPVYVGRSGVEAEAAIKARTDLAQFHWSRGLPRGIIKRNGAITPLAAPASSYSPEQGESRQPSYEDLKNSLCAAVAEIARLRDLYEPADLDSLDNDQAAYPDSTASPAGEGEDEAGPVAPASPGSLAPGGRRRK